MSVKKEKVLDKVSKEENNNCSLEAESSEEKKEEETRPGEVIFKKPLKRGESELKGTILRMPKPGEMRGLKLVLVAQGDVDSMIKVIPRISNPPLTEHEVSDIHLADFSSLSAVVIDFLG